VAISIASLYLDVHPTIVHPHVLGVTSDCASLSSSRFALAFFLVLVTSSRSGSGVARTILACDVDKQQV
jgi:hypothetical protein